MAILIDPNRTESLETHRYGSITYCTGLVMGTAGRFGIPDRFSWPNRIGTWSVCFGTVPKTLLIILSFYYMQKNIMDMQEYVKGLFDHQFSSLLNESA